MTQAKHSQIELDPLTGADSTALNTFLNAVRAGGSYITFSEHFSESFSDFFTKCLYTDDEGDTHQLNIMYKTLPLHKVQQLFEQVYTARSEELKTFLEAKEVKLQDMDELERAKFYLLYHFGSKIGGYPAVASLTPTETFKLMSVFLQIQNDINRASKTR